MRFGSLFSGIGGFDLGFERAGMTCAWQVEIDDFCNRVLEKHWPNVPRFRDVRDVGRNNLESVDVICGGFPCQDVSLAGNRLGLEGKRSTLWSEFYRIICEIRPRWVVIENVPGLLSSDDGRFFAKILRELSEGGYDAEWRIISASDVGAPHIRERLWIVAYANGKYITDSIWQRNSDTSIEWTEKGFWSSDWVKSKLVSRVSEILYRWEEYSIHQPVFVRVDDGVPDVLDRLHSLGNALVPQVAELIGKRLVEVDNETTPN